MEPLAATKAPAGGGGWGGVRLVNAASGRKLCCPKCGKLSTYVKRCINANKFYN